MNNPSHPFIAAFKNAIDNENVKFVVGQLEVGESGTRHVQGYIHLVKKKRRAWFSVLFPNWSPHFEKARGTPKDNVKYCTKDEGRIEGPWMFGDMPTTGKAALMEKLWTSVTSGQDPLEMLEETPALAVHPRAWAWVNELHMRKLGNRWRDVDVTLLVGAPGVGKTLLPVLKHGYDDIYTMTKLNKGAIWFDNYIGQDAVVVDDFDSGWSVEYRALLRILDGHPLRLPVKGHFTYALYTKVYITTNAPLREWYPKESDLSALQRRINRTIVFDAAGVMWENGTRLGKPRDVFGNPGPDGKGVTTEVVPGSGSGGNTTGGGTPLSPEPPSRLSLTGQPLRLLARQDGFIHTSSLRRDALLLHNIRAGGNDDGTVSLSAQDELDDNGGEGPSGPEFHDASYRDLLGHD